MDLSVSGPDGLYPNDEFAQMVNGDLEEAYNIYVASNHFKHPVLPQWVIIDPATMEPNWRGLSGDIYVPVNFDSLDVLKQKLTHELFHAIQNRYYNVYAAGSSSRCWWHEACADCASKSLVMGWTSPFPGGLTQLFLVQPLTTFNEHHEYDVANFLDYLFRHSNGKLDFQTHFTNLAVAGITLNSTLARLADLVHSKTGKELQAYYREFAADFLFNKNGYCPKLDPWSNPINAKNQHTFPMDSPGYSQTFWLNGGYSAHLLATKVVAATGPRKLTVSISPPTGDALIDVYHLSSLRLDSPPQPVTLEADGTIFINDGEYLCFVAVNYNPDTDSSITATVEGDLNTTIKGTTTYQLTEGSPSAFTIKGDWTLTGQVVSCMTNHVPDSGVYVANFTVRTNPPINFQWNYKLGRNPAETTEPFAWGTRVWEYAQPTIDGKTILVGSAGNPIIQKTITDSAVTLYIQFTDTEHQSASLSLNARPLYSYTDYDNNGKILNQYSDHDGGMGDMMVVFRFSPTP